jgi:hypothetical protein
MTDNERTTQEQRDELRTAWIEPREIGDTVRGLIDDLTMWKRRALVAEEAFDNLAIITTADAGLSLREEAERRLIAAGRIKA